MFKLPLRKLYFLVKLCFIFVVVLVTLSLFEYWRGGRRATRAVILDPDEDLYERQILEDEARIIPGLGEGGRPAYLTGEDKRLGEETEKKYAVNTYLSDRIAYNRTLKDFRNPACERVTYDAELPSTSVIIIFHNEPYSVVIRTIWSVLNTARRDQPWHRRANYLERGTGRVMKLGYPGQPEDSEHVYLKEIILVDDNSTLPELRGKLARYIRTRFPLDMVRVLRLPDRLGLTRARHAGAGAATGDVLMILDSHCEGNEDWLRPLLQRIKDSPKSVLVPMIDALMMDTFGYISPGQLKLKVGADARIFLDSHCEGVADWIRPLLYRLKESPKSVLVPIVDMIEINTFAYDPVNLYTFQGLMRARVTGARAARGDVLVFLDAHCEAESDWLRPLLQRISHKRDAVPTPVIDVVDQTTFHLDGEDPIQVGGFTFVGHFTWIDVPEREKKRRGSDIAPTWSPTMAGGLFAIRREYYWELGAYDEQMAGWGGENLEMSFRIWQCGGTLETIPCSRVGHVFRAFHPYGLPANSDTHGINTARMAEVWMDEYAELFYLHRPDLRKNPKIGDVTHRKILREKLHCKSFQWFLDNVYQEKYVPVRDSQAFGRVSNMATNLCLDTMQREGEATPLGFYPCHAQLTDTQFLSLSLSGQLRDEERCAEIQFMRLGKRLLRVIKWLLTSAHLSAEDESAARVIVMVTCRDGHATKMWRHMAGTGQLQHVASGLCVDARAARAGDDAAARPCARGGAPSQRWAFDYDGENSHSGVLPAELEQRLSKIKGQRRKSRSLLSVSAEEGARARRAGAGAGAGEGERERGGGEAQGEGGRARAPRVKRRRRNKRKQKRVHKNKFIVTVERTLPNSSVEHLEMDIHCKHRRLYPNNSFVRDLVAILNEKDIRVINNGRVFDKNKVTDLKDHLRNQERAQISTEPDEGSPEATTPTKPWASAPLSTQHTHTADDVAVPTTEFAKTKKRHHKKRYPKRARERLEHSLLLDDSSDQVAIGGLNHTDAKLRAGGRAGEPERDHHTHGKTVRPWSPSSREFYVHTARPDSVEIHLTARDKHARGDRDYSDKDHRDNTHADNNNSDNKARSEAIARHASVYEFKKVAGERGRKERHGGKTRAQMLSEIQGNGIVESRSWPPARQSSGHHAGAERWGARDSEQDPWDPWDPWAPRDPHAPRVGDVPATDVVVDTRKHLPGDPHDAVAKLVFEDVWDKDPPKDRRVSDLARQVMMEYDEPTQPPSPPQLRAAPADSRGPDSRGGPGTLGGPDTRDAGGKPLRLRVKSNMTFNLGDELLNWRRMQMGGPESESESVSDEEASRSA